MVRRGDPEATPRWVRELTLEVLADRIAWALGVLVALIVTWLVGVLPTLLLVGLGGFLAGVLLGMALAVAIARRQPQFTSEEILARLTELGMVRDDAR
jgi:hypothetical protein